MITDVLNLDCFSGPKGEMWRQRARGAAVVDGQTVMNGGIVNPQREHLAVGQYYYRFVSSGDPPAAKVTGAWWINYDSLNSIYAHYQHTGANPSGRKMQGSGPEASSIREWLALTYGWNKIQEVVVARLMARLDAWTGAGRPARGTHVFDNRAFGYPPHLYNLFSIKQLCIPDLRTHGAKAFPETNIYPVARLGELKSAGRLM